MTNLNIALGIATEMRLRTYLANKGQKEDFSAMSKYEIDGEYWKGSELIEHVFYLKEISLLYRYYYTVIDMELMVVNTKYRISFINALQTSDIYEESPIIKGYIHERFLQYNKAIVEFEKEITLLDTHVSTINSLAVLYNKVGQYEKALNLYIHLNDKVTNQIDLAVLLYNKGGVLYNLSRYQEALDAKNNSLVIYRNFHNQESNIADVLDSIGSIYLHISNYKEALEKYQASFDIRQRIDQEGSLGMFNSLNNIGIILEKLGRYDEALEYLNKSLEMGYRICRGDYRIIARSMYGIASVFSSLNNDIQALNYLQICLKIRQEILKGNNLDVVRTLNAIGHSYTKLEKYIEAILFHKASLKMVHNLSNKGNLDNVAASLNNMGQALVGLKKYEEALKYYNNSLRLMNKIYQSDHTYIVTLLSNIGSILHRFKKYEEALKVRQDSLTMKKRICSKTNTEYNTLDTANSLHNLGNTQLKLKMLSVALKSYNDSLHIMEKIYQTNHPDIASCLTIIATIYDKLGNYEQALDCYYKSFVMLRNISGTNPEDMKVILANMTSLLEAIIHENCKDQNIYLVIKYNEMLKDIYPDDAGIKQDLGCYYHVEARTIKQTQEDHLLSLDKANNNFLQSLKLDPHSGIYTEYANFLIINNRYQEALENLYIALSLKKDSKSLGYSVMEKPIVSKDLQQEIDFYDNIELKSDYFAYYLLITYHKELNLDPRKTLHYLKEFQQEVDNYPNPLSYSLLGYTYVALEKYDQARKNFNKAIEINPEYLIAKMNYINCHKILSKDITHERFDGLSKAMQDPITVQTSWKEYIENRQNKASIASAI